MSTEEVIRIVTVFLGSSLLTTLITLWFNRRQMDAQIAKLRVDAASVEKKADSDYAESLLKSSKQVDERRDSLIEDLRADFDNEKKTTANLMERILNMERTISELKAKLAESARYRTFFNIMTHPAMFIDAESGEILDVNIRTLDLFGYTREEIVKMRFNDLLSRKEDGRFIRDNVSHAQNVVCVGRDRISFSQDMRVSYYTEESRRVAIIAMMQKAPIALRDRILDLLESVRSQFSASYSTLWILHNGTNDENGKPIYRVSAEYEACKTGLKYLADSFQFMPLTMFEKSLEGFKNGKRYVIITSDDEGHDAIVGAMKHAKIETFIMVNVLDTEGRLMGFVSTSFSKKSDVSQELIMRLLDVSTSDVVRAIISKKTIP